MKNVFVLKKTKTVIKNGTKNQETEIRELKCK